MYFTISSERSTATRELGLIRRISAVFFPVPQPASKILSVGWILRKLRTVRPMTARF